MDDEGAMDSKRWLACLRDEMATLKWEIYERNPVWKRSEIPDGYWENEVAERVAEWPSLLCRIFLMKCIRIKILLLQRRRLLR